MRLEASEPNCIAHHNETRNNDIEYETTGAGTTDL